jgi:hypothetical protein
MTAHHIEHCGMILRTACLVALLLACAGCGKQVIVMEGNYVTLEHPFTEAGAESARALAAKECKARKQVAVRTGGACSLTLCTTHFQCMDAAEAKQYQP